MTERGQKHWPRLYRYYWAGVGTVAVLAFLAWAFWAVVEPASPLNPARNYEALFAIVFILFVALPAFPLFARAIPPIENRFLLYRIILPLYLVAIYIVGRAAVFLLQAAVLAAF